MPRRSTSRTSRIQARERPLCGVGDEVIDGAEPAQGPRRELDEQGAVAFVGEMRAGLCDCGWKIGSIGVDRLQHAQRRDASGGDHESRVPAANGAAGEELARGHRALAFGLQREDEEDAVAGSHANRVAGRVDDGAGFGSRLQAPGSRHLLARGYGIPAGLKSRLQHL